MGQKLLISIEELSERAWEDVVSYSLTNEQIYSLVLSKKLNGTKLSSLEDFSFEDHIHIGAKLNYVMKGHITYVYEEKRFELGKGDLIIIPANVLHREHIGAPELWVVEYERKKE